MSSINRKWDWILVAILIVYIFIVFSTDNKILLNIATIFVIATLLFSIIRSVTTWINNKNVISNNFIKLRNKSSIGEIVMIICLIYNIKTSYNTRESYLNIIENKSITINNFTDFLNSYDGNEKILSYLILFLIVFNMVAIVQNILLKQLISSEGVLLNNGELVMLNEVSKIKVEETFFGLSKRITLEQQKGYKTVYLNKKKIEDLKILLSTYYLGEIEGC